MNLVHDLLKESADRWPERPALICDGKIHTFGRIDQDSDRIACELQREGLSRGDRVAVFMENSAELVVSLFGILKAGGVSVIINSTTKEKKLAYILNDCSVRALICDRRLSRIVEPVVDELPSLKTVIWSGAAPRAAEDGRTFEQIMAEPHTRPANPDLIDLDLASIIYTSGSTGSPKGVMLTHRNMANSARAIATYLDNVPEDVVMCVLPVSFSYGLYQIIVGMRVGYTVVLERSFAYPYRVLQRLAEHRVTGLPGVPTVFARMLQMAPFEGLDLSSLRYITNAGAPIPPAHVLRLQEQLPQVRIFLMYGQTECTRVSYLDPDRVTDKVTSAGKAMPNTSVYVVDDEGSRVGPGVVGELVVRGSNVMRGYWGKPEQTRRSLRDGDIPGERVLYTGDLFKTDEEGFLYFVARKDDIFKCKGEKVCPKEVEDALCELPEVAEAAVIGVDDPIDGMAVKAFVVPSDGAALSEEVIRHHCRARLDNYMVPKFVEFRESLPKTGSGKIRRRDLRELEQEGSLTSSERISGSA